MIARKPIRVMIVDDSAIVRQVASEAIAAQTDMRVLATASDPLFAIVPDQVARITKASRWTTSPPSR